MPYFGYSEQGRLGEICHQITEAGKIRIVDTVAGEIREYGSPY